MTRAWLWVSLLTLMGGGAVQAASYQLGIPPFSVVGPIQNTYGGDSSYSGSNLEPSADLNYADLNFANLPFAMLNSASLNYSTLRYANLSDAYFSEAGLLYADLSNANLSYATLNFAFLNYADLSHANLSNASLSYSNLSSTLLYSADLSGTASWLWATWTGAKYSINAVDNAGNPIPDTIFPAGMDQAWRDAAGMVAVPEPTTALLVGLGLLGLGVRRRVR